ncbi:hypothetical protein BK133_03305 [Paenibacillus sp. FSL H8-0548]|uniref:hypothetical protein n=1 Tax=Paenibacillus sp. FSL H8-0548 TaxID=1920422 RepID=UPI00096FFAF3|nr:hypothetical protein [Paenibacillus sp. FSL H8-0548]OMF38022.1 hypothetical protein BK133_03305 [Paenibacillus sp. FSL H8-0548]
MSIDTTDRHQARVELVIDIIKGIFEKETIPEAFKEKLNTMSYDDLGIYVMNIVKKRSFDEVL